MKLKKSCDQTENFCCFFSLSRMFALGHMCVRLVKKNAGRCFQCVCTYEHTVNCTKKNCVCTNYKHSLLGKKTDIYISKSTREKHIRWNLTSNPIETTMKKVNAYNAKYNNNTNYQPVHIRLVWEQSNIAHTNQRETYSTKQTATLCKPIAAFLYRQKIEFFFCSINNIHTCSFIKSILKRIKKIQQHSTEYPH